MIYLHKMNCNRFVLVNRSFLSVLFSMLVANLSAKRVEPVVKSSTQNQVAHIASAYADSLTRSINYYRTSWRYEKSDTLANPYYFQLFSPQYVYPSAIDDAFQWGGTDYSETHQEMGQLLAQTYAAKPAYFSLHERDGHRPMPLPEQQTANPLLLKGEENHPANPKNDFSFDGEPLDITVYKPNFWTFKPNFSLQFMQTYVSSNWYKGGDSHNSLLGTFNLDANYNNKSKINFDNKLEMKLGFQSSRDDKIHKYKANSDLLRLTNKFGLKAATNWYYTLLLQSWTQFYPGYKSNDQKVYSDFMSPFESVFSIGMDYKLSKKKFNLTVTMSPLACDFIYVDRRALETSFGLRRGHHSKFDYGSNLTATYTWNIWTGIQWSGRVYYFTDYKRVQMEWENTFNLTINKYLSTKLFVYPRFDDGVSKKSDSYFQFNEWLSLGLNLSF